MEEKEPTKQGRRWRHHLLWLMGSVTACCLLILLAVTLLEDRFVFRSEHNRFFLPPPAELPVQEIWLRTADHIRIHAWWCPYPEAKGAVLFCHGQGGTLSHRGKDLLKLRESLQESVLIFDYPGFGRSEGAATEQGCYAAADAAYDWLAQETPPERIILLGQSLGGGVATDLASRRSHRALVLFKTFTSVPEVAGKYVPFVSMRWLFHNQFDNLRKIRSCSKPTFIAHGESDHLIPLSQARQLYAAAPEIKRFFLLDGEGHHGKFSHEFLSEVVAFLKETLPFLP